MTTAELSFPVEEYRSRLDRTQSLMRSLGVDLLVLDETEAMTWLSGYGVSENLWRCCVVPITAEPFLIIRSLDLPPARLRTWFTDIVAFKDWDDPLRILGEELGRRGIGRARIGIDLESYNMTVARFERLRSILPDATFVAVEGEIAQLRRTKSPAEIACLRRVAGIADAAMRDAVKAVRVGGTQRDVAAAVAAAYYKLGADDGWVGPITAGTDWDSLHAPLRAGTLERGSIVHVELVPRLRGYTARIMRSVVVGRATPQQQETAALLAELQDRQLAALRPGARARDIDRILRQPMIERGLRPSYDNITGYTVGLIPGTSPHTSDFTRAFTPEADWVVEAGMVLHMYTSARGLAFSETMVVTESGSERLGSTARTLFEAE